MSFSLQFGKSTTLDSSGLAAGGTTATLSSAAFTNFTSDYLVVDYDVPSKREVILCNVTGTSVTSITRAQAGTSDQAHSSSAKICYAFVPGHYANGLGTIAANDSWTSFSASPTGWSGTPTQTFRYVQFGKLVMVSATITGTSNSVNTGFTLPVAAKSTLVLMAGAFYDNGTFSNVGVTLNTTATTTTVTVFTTPAGGAWTNSGGKGIYLNFFYEAN